MASEVPAVGVSGYTQYVRHFGSLLAVASAARAARHMTYLQHVGSPLAVDSEAEGFRFDDTRIITLWLAAVRG